MALIKKRKLTKNQNRQIQKNQNAIVDDGTLAAGVIISHFGKQLDVQITTPPKILPTNHTDNISIGAVWRCHARTNLPMLTTGDRVRFSLDTTTHLGLIQSLDARHTLISRPDRYHKLKPVAANADILAIVFAPLPKPATNLIDRYLLVAKLSKLAPLLILNKADMLDDHPEVLKIFNEYQELGQKYGFKTIQTSSVSSSHIDTLKQHIAGKLTIFAGQSGVGKSSLINQILPNANQHTNIISVGSQLGQHTTTTSRLLPYDPTNLNAGGVIDTPGIREYGIWHLSVEDIMMGFDELNERQGHCQFRDCNHHQNAKGCALWQAVADGHILARRVESFNELIEEVKTGK